MFIAMLILCSILFIGIGIFAIRKESPMWFWAGGDEEIKREVFRDVKAFNRKNGIMWIAMGCLFLIPIILRMMHPFPEWILGIFLAFLAFFGMIVMMIYWEHLHDVYTSRKD